MKFGISIINFGWFADVHEMVKTAVAAEKAGWDGFFLWDHLLVFKDQEPVPFLDPYVALSAIACNTTKIKIGPMITPIPRRRPWKLARETVTLDHLSNGRLILGVGLGAPPDPEFTAFGEDGDTKVRAEKLDEGLEILTGLWSGRPFSFKGEHFQLDEMTFIPAPVQSPRIPIWVGGGWPHKKPFKRAARYEGVIPVHSGWPEPLEPKHIKDVLSIVQAERGNLTDYDVVVSGETSGVDITKDAARIEAWADVGATWWLEDINGMRGNLDELVERIKMGPPRTDS
jgi:alkanesulfonate monooxygenase SsuD/methylene tetrahydromethanopterin reductase-like flavin-dependent oxidoreductase (luciferase family)